MNHLSKPSFAASGHPFVLGYVGAVLTASVLVAFFLLIAHEQAERSAVVALRNITDVVEARVDASLRRIQSNLEQLATEIPDAALDQSNVAHFLDQINRDLDGRASHFPELSALRIFAANGDKLYESGLALPSYSIADRAYFRSAKANPRQPLIFSEAILSRASKRPIVVIARPLTNPAKQFRGIVVGALEMGYFTDFFSTLDLGAQGSISLRRTEDGGMLARWPDTSEVLNVPYKPDHPLRQWLASSEKQGTQKIVARADGIERLYAYSRLEKYPFFIIVGRTQQDYLANWRQTAAIAITFSLTVLLLLGIILRRLWRAEQRRAETGLRNFKAIVDSTDDAVISKTLEGIIESWNRGAETLYGYTAEEAIGQPMQLLIPPDRLNEEPKILERIARGDKVEHFETVRRHKDGHLIDISATISPVFDETGKVIGASKIARDITERKQMEEALKAREIKLSTIIDTEPECVKLLARDGSLQQMNRAGLNMIEAESLDQVAGRSVLGIIAPEFQNAFMALTNKVFQGNPGVLEFEIIGLKGTHRWLESHAVPLRDSHDKIISLLSVTRDITERKQTEAALAQKTIFLNERVKELNCLYQTSSLMAESNKSKEELLKEAVSLIPLGWQYPAITCARIVIGEQAFITDNFRETPWKLSADITVSGKAVGSAEVRYLEGTPALDEGPFLKEERDLIGNLAREYGAMVERKQTEKEIMRSNAELEQFSYAISHDMRQPLRMISSYLKLIKNGLATQLDSENSEYFNFAIDGANRLDQMIVGLLEYSRVGRRGEPPEWIESRSLLDEALLYLRSAIAEAQAEVQVEGSWPRIFVSPDEVMRLLQNLIGNAVKFRVSGRIPKITVTGEMFDNEWRVCVADNGAGILPDQIGRLFQVFQRLQSRNKYEGTGIGLALCRKIAEHHRGRIWAESAGEGQGSQFYVSLPQGQENAQQV